jgi:protein-S-isoprenylcysteine O-methyltransferase Ste14
MALQEEFTSQGQWLFRYRGTAPLILLIAGLGVYLYSRTNPSGFVLGAGLPEIYFELICMAVSVVGLIVRIYTVGHTPQNTSGRNVKKQVADVLNTTGSYSVVRHPLYVGNFLMWLGPAILTGNLWFMAVFTLVYWLYYERIMFAEEQYLREKFGEPYLQWAGKVPAFIPDLRKFTRSDRPFSWKKIVLKEKNGLAAMFLVFMIFDMAGELIRNQSGFNWVFIVGASVTTLFYLILTLIKRRTSWLKTKPVQDPAT